MGCEQEKISAKEVAEQFNNENPLLKKSNTDIENRFTYHAPKPGQPEIYTAIRDKAKELAVMLDINCPDSREKSVALTKLEEAVMWANASVARYS